MNLTDCVIKFTERLYEAEVTAAKTFYFCVSTTSASSQTVQMLKEFWHLLILKSEPLKFSGAGNQTGQFSVGFFCS